MTKGELDGAIRRAFNILDGWNNVAGVVQKNTGYYYELQGVIEDAVHCGAQAATGDYKKLDAEESFWEFVSRTSAKVKKWPAWKRGGSTP